MSVSRSEGGKPSPAAPLLTETHPGKTGSRRPAVSTTVALRIRWAVVLVGMGGRGPGDGGSRFLIGRPWRTATTTTTTVTWKCP